MGKVLVVGVDAPANHNPSPNSSCSLVFDQTAKPNIIGPSNTFVTVAISTASSGS